MESCAAVTQFTQPLEVVAVGWMDGWMEESGERKYVAGGAYLGWCVWYGGCHAI